MSTLTLAPVSASNSGAIRRQHRGELIVLRREVERHALDKACRRPSRRREPNETKTPNPSAVARPMNGFMPASPSLTIRQASTLIFARSIGLCERPSRKCTQARSVFDRAKAHSFAEDRFPSRRGCDSNRGRALEELMRAASARAIASQRNAATEEGLERAVAWSRQWSAEFPFCLANHLPMVLVALHRMGASDERLEAYCRVYHQQNGLVPVPEPIDEITRPQLARIFGRTRARGRLSRVFRRRSCAAWRDAGRNSLSPAAHARRRGERHPRAHAHGLCDADRQRRGDQRRARLLGGDLSSAQAFARGSRPRPTIRPRFSPSCIGPEAFRHVEPERDLLWHFMRAVAEKPEFAPVVDMLAIGPDTHDRVAARLRLRSTPRRSTSARCMR